MPCFRGDCWGLIKAAACVFDYCPERWTLAAIFSRARFHALTSNSLLLFFLGSLVWTIGIIAFLASVASPYDDALQHEVFQPKSPNIAVNQASLLTSGARKIPKATQTLIVAVANLFGSREVLGSIGRTGKARPSYVGFRPSLTLRSPPVC